MTSQDKTNIHL